MAADYLNDTGGDSSAWETPAGCIRPLPDEALKWRLCPMIYVLRSSAQSGVTVFTFSLEKHAR